MGYYSDGKTQKSQFDPRDDITIAEIATIISRMLRGNRYEGTDVWRYQSHLLALTKKGIIPPDIDPTRKETRLNVYTMLFQVQT